MMRCFFCLFLLNAYIGLGQVIIRDNFIKGTIIRYANFPSLVVEPRNVDIWFPPDYDTSGHSRYAVLYMHDGQNLFTPVTAQNKEEWRVDETLDSLMHNNLVRKTIVIGIWSTPNRSIEYNPEDAFNMLDSNQKAGFLLARKTGSSANAYLYFIFSELKPFIDKSFPVKADVKNTFMFGSEMGALISLYALCKKSDQIKGVACLSTQWKLSLNQNYSSIARSYINYFGRKLPNPRQHKIYFDYGTSMPDSLYESYQKLMDANCAENAYIYNKDFLTIKFEASQHSETALKNRMALPLKFLLN